MSQASNKRLNAFESLKHSRFAEGAWQDGEHPKDFVPAGAPGWTERSIRDVLQHMGNLFPECRFALAVFEPASEFPTKVLFGPNSDRDIEPYFAELKLRPEWLTASRENRGVIDTQGGLPALIPKFAERQPGLFDAHHLVTFVMPGLLHVVMATWRSSDFGQFRELEMGPLREHAQAIASIIRMGHEVAASQTRELAANLDRLRLGFVVVDQLLRLHLANEVAREMFGQGLYFLETEYTLKLADAASEMRLRQLISHIAPLSKQSADASGVIAIRSANAEMMARCVANIQRDADDALLGAMRFGLTFSSQTSAAAVQPSQLRRLGFTPAEAELAADLLRGLTVTQHAQERGIAVATARAHLKRAMMRVGVHRQADLIRHIMGLS